VNSHKKNHSGFSVDEHKPLSNPSADFAKLAPFLSTFSDVSWQFPIIFFSSVG
jgi:hypothetical protein